MRQRVFYTVESYSNVQGTWTISGAGPGGKTLAEARDRVREDVARCNPKMLNHAKFVIKKHIEIEEVEEEYQGKECTFLLLNARA